MTTSLAHVTRTARRATGGDRWRCFWCWQQIVNGERYKESRYVDRDADSIGTSRAHVECSEAYHASDMDEDEAITEAQPRGGTQCEAMDAEARALAHAGPDDDRSPAGAE